MICCGSHIGTRIRKSFLNAEQWLLTIIGLVTIGAFPASIFVMALLKGGFGTWIACSVVRMGVDLSLVQFLFGWLTRKIAAGER